VSLREILPGAYARHGHEVREGAGSGAMRTSTAVWKDGRRLDTGSGVSWADIQVWETLALSYTPRAVFGIGNGFGWSTLALRHIWPAAELVVLDAETEGTDNEACNGLTRTLLAEHSGGLIVHGSSPHWVANAAACLGIPAGFVFIDGEHTNEAMDTDFDAVRAFLAAEHIVFFHDVGLMRMLDSWTRIAALYPERARLLETPTGMGVVWAGEIGADLR
jgi:Methyltransferase domain